MSICTPEYEIISSPIADQNPSKLEITDSPEVLPSSIVYKITQSDKVPKVVLFTNSTGLLHHLLLHG